jgi:hypothetical protein
VVGLVPDEPGEAQALAKRIKSLRFQGDNPKNLVVADALTVSWGKARCEARHILLGSP